MLPLDKVELLKQHRHSITLQGRRTHERSWWKVSGKIVVWKWTYMMEDGVHSSVQAFTSLDKLKPVAQAQF